MKCRHWIIVNRRGPLGGRNGSANRFTFLKLQFLLCCLRYNKFSDQFRVTIKAAEIEIGSSIRPFWRGRFLNELDNEMESIELQVTRCTKWRRTAPQRPCSSSWMRNWKLPRLSGPSILSVLIAAGEEGRKEERKKHYMEPTKRNETEEMNGNIKDDTCASSLALALLIWNLNQCFVFPFASCHLCSLV